jgi:hypothetical protein
MTTLLYKQDALYALAGVQAKLISTRKQLDSGNPVNVKIAESLLPGMLARAEGLAYLAATLPERPALMPGYASQNIADPRPSVPEGSLPDYAAGIDLDIPAFLKRKKT